MTGLEGGLLNRAFAGMTGPEVELGPAVKPQDETFAGMTGPEGGLLNRAFAGMTEKEMNEIARSARSAG